MVYRKNTQNDKLMREELCPLGRRQHLYKQVGQQILMESCLRKMPDLAIIPKISTETALACLKCMEDSMKFWFIRVKIVTDMNRENE